MPVACLAPLSLRMASPRDDVAKLVRDDTLKLVEVVGRFQQARLDVDDLSLGDEGVDLRIVDQHHRDGVRVESGGDDQRPRHVLEQPFGLRVAEDRRPGIVLRESRAGGSQNEQ